MLIEQVGQGIEVERGRFLKVEAFYPRAEGRCESSDSPIPGTHLPSLEPRIAGSGGVITAFMIVRETPAVDDQPWLELIFGETGVVGSIQLRMLQNGAALWDRSPSTCWGSLGST